MQKDKSVLGSRAKSVVRFSRAHCRVCSRSCTNSYKPVSSHHGSCLRSTRCAPKYSVGKESRFRDRTNCRSAGRICAPREATSQSLQESRGNRDHPEDTTNISTDDRRRPDRRTGHKLLGIWSARRESSQSVRCTFERNRITGEVSDGAASRTLLWMKQVYDHAH